MTFRLKLSLCLFACILGILLSHYDFIKLEAEQHIKLLVGFAFLLMFQSYTKARFYDFTFWTILISFTALGYVNESSEKRVHLNHFSKALKPAYLDAEILETKPYRTGQRLIVRSLRVFENSYEMYTCSGKLLLRSFDSTGAEVGDLLRFPLRPKLIVNDSKNDFDAKSYWNRQGVFHEQNLGEELTLYSPEEIQVTFRIRDELKRRLNMLYNVSETGFLNALLIGDKNSMSVEEKASFKRAGLMHILVVSGMHVGIVYLLITFLIRPFRSLRSHKFLEVVVVLTGIWTYSFLTGNGVSVLRACTMLSLYTVLRALNRKVKGLDVLLISAFFLLAWKPAELFSLGFQLSYSAMVGIFLLYPRFTGFFRPRQKLLVYAWNLTCLSLAAQIGTLPLISYYFGEIAVFSLISNLLVSPVLVLLMASASLSIVAVEVPQILMLLQSCTKGLLYYISLIASHIAQDDNAVIMYRASVEHVLWIYLGIFLLAFGMKPSLLKWSLSAGSLLFIVGCILNF